MFSFGVADNSMVNDSVGITITREHSLHRECFKEPENPYCPTLYCHVKQETVGYNA